MIREPGLELVLKDEPVRIRRNRQTIVVVPHEEGAVLVFEPQLPALEHHAILVAKDRDQHLVRQLVLDGMPLDVEKVRVSRAGAVLEHVHPPRVRRLRYAHVVGHYVEHVAHAARLQRVDPRPVVVARSRSPG